MKVILSLFLIALLAYGAGADSIWMNNITVNEYNMTWSYTETFNGSDSVMYRINIDTELGDNDSFVNAWEVLKTDKETRKKLKSAIDSEPDVRINNVSEGIRIIDMDSNLSSAIIGRTHSTDTIVNRFIVSYQWNESILNMSSIWFLGQARSPVTVVLPAGLDIVNISGMDNITKNINNLTGISGYFAEVSKNRGEITINFTKNTSRVFWSPDVNLTNASNTTSSITDDNTTEQARAFSSKIRYGIIITAGFVMILLIYIFKIRKN